MLTDDKKLAFWEQLSNAFNVHVRGIDVGMKDGDEITVVTVDDKTDPAVIAGLPKEFANEVVHYKTSGPVAVAGCGQPGHNCLCGMPSP